MTTWTITEIKKKIEAGSFSAAELEQFRQDTRKGVQKLMKQYEKKQAKKAQLKAQFEEMMAFEYAAREKGKQMIAGIDEAGRGPLAGPVVAGAVVLPDHFYLEGLNDSKKLSLSKREQYFDYIKEHADYGVGIVSNEEIDQLNIYQATKLAMKRAVEDLNHAPDHLLVDAMELDQNISQQSLIKGDARSVSIAAASVIAKVTRDRYMGDLHESYPMYQFASNQGYGTSEHLSAMREHGISPYHRHSFSPVREVRSGQ
ncbi:ribonuclease HII [Halobacillus litoralis]|uniref:ribonuclease HII n=1 Tax=Halobacillus litoralis TaxID=45668 RepID=UPI001CD54A3E|nr:ribonuclease HII [Halobacillus litoralis]MCA0969159.1 ribonuclease HII [Halobacillus litoralis]